VFETEEREHQACLLLQGEHVVVCTAEALSEGIAGNHPDAEMVRPFVNSGLDAGTLAHLRLIAARSAGYDHIDLRYCPRASHYGARVIEIARGFGMKVAAFVTKPDEVAARRLGVSLLPISRFACRSQHPEISARHGTERRLLSR
jgi:lactate dehydrogenase-like 2-hydroxyacid dehydrogenase